MFVHVPEPQVEFLMEWLVVPSALLKMVLTLADVGVAAVGWSFRLPASPDAKYLPMSDSVVASGVLPLAGTLEISVLSVVD